MSAAQIVNQRPITVTLKHQPKKTTATPPLAAEKRRIRGHEIVRLTTALGGSLFQRRVPIDSVGHVWVTNLNSDTVIELVGAAVPVKTPFIGPPQLP